MKKLALLLIIIIAASCSKDDVCQKVTLIAATKNSNGTFTYTIQIDNGEVQTTNKATVDFYSHIEAPECYEGMK
jgi:hypothetical protein